MAMQQTAQEPAAQTMGTSASAAATTAAAIAPATGAATIAATAVAASISRAMPARADFGAASIGLDQAIIGAVFLGILRLLGAVVTSLLHTAIRWRNRLLVGRVGLVGRVRRGRSTFAISTAHAIAIAAHRAAVHPVRVTGRWNDA